MLGTALSVAGLVACSWLALVALLALQERRLIFFPTRTLAAGPADYGLRAEELSITAADGVTLHGWWIAGPGERVLIWYHGNAGNIGDRLHNARWFVDRLGVDVVLVDYRGYGRSRGTPDEAGLYLDGLAVYDAVAARGVRAEDVILFGRSLGGAIAIETALRRPAGALVLESVFRSVRALAREHYWFIPTAVIRTRMDNESKIARVEVPTLVLHGRPRLHRPAGARPAPVRAGRPPDAAACHRRRGAQRHVSRRRGTVRAGVGGISAGYRFRRVTGRKYWKATAMTVLERWMRTRVVRRGLDEPLRAILQ